MLDSLEQSALGVWTASSPAGYYIMLAFHAVGLAMLVGSVWVIDLRLLGFVQGINEKAMAGLVKFAWWGLGINAVSGFALFTSEANKAFYSTSFRVKILLMLTGVVSTVILNQSVLQPTFHKGGHAVSASSARGQAYFSLAIWAAVIVVGRLMSYWTEFYGTTSLS
jgi:hypothetical protein